jgi:methyltransferase (TIGR00027 family)
MFGREGSRTALATAYLRAAHQILDAEPRILEDPVALVLLGSGAAERIRASVERYQTPAARALRSHVVLRSRYAEDRLALAVQRDVTQYVVLGAGFDTFALRQPGWAHALRILEVDHAATQALKRARLAEAHRAAPANVAFAQIDFEHESLKDGLLRHHVSLAQPTFFSWLGVTMYLQEAAIDAALRCMAAFPPGSEVVLTFLRPAAHASPEARAALSLLARRVADAGEPFVSAFEPEVLEAKLLDAGFGSVEFLLPEEADARYFRARPRDLPVPKAVGIASAVR